MRRAVSAPLNSSSTMWARARRSGEVMRLAFWCERSCHTLPVIRPSRRGHEPNKIVASADKVLFSQCAVVKY